MASFVPGRMEGGTGVSAERCTLDLRSYRIPGGMSREGRMRILAEASGSFNTLLNLGWGRFIGPRPLLPERVEDTSGVT